MNSTNGWRKTNIVKKFPKLNKSDDHSHRISNIPFLHFSSFLYNYCCAWHFKVHLYRYISLTIDHSVARFFKHWFHIDCILEHDSRFDSSASWPWSLCQIQGRFLRSQNQIGWSKCQIENSISRWFFLNRLFFGDLNKYFRWKSNWHLT